MFKYTLSLCVQTIRMVCQLSVSNKWRYVSTSDLLAKTTEIHNPSVITPYFTSTVSTLNICFNDYIRYLGQGLFRT